MAGGRETEHISQLPTCAGCGDRIGVYEPVLLERSGVIADRTSLVGLGAGAPGGAVGPLWHEVCGRAAGLRPG
jgi:hypothetical protein